jgi:hypothetical protein
LFFTFYFGGNKFYWLYKRVMGVSQNNILSSYKMNFNAYNVSQMSLNVQNNKGFLAIKLAHKVDDVNTEVKMLLPAMALQWQIREPLNAQGKWDVDLKIVDTNLTDMLREIDQLNMDCMVDEATSFLRMTRLEAVDYVPANYKSIVIPRLRDGNREETFVKVKAQRRSSETCKIMRIVENHEDVNQRVTTPLELADVRRDDICQVEVSFALFNTALFKNAGNKTSIGCTINVSRMWVLPRRVLRDEEVLNPLVGIVIPAPNANPFGGLGPMVQTTDEDEEIKALEKILADAKESRKRKAESMHVEQLVAFVNQ